MGITTTDIRDPSGPRIVHRSQDLVIHNLIQHNQYLLAAGRSISSAKAQVAVYDITQPFQPWLLSISDFDVKETGFSIAAHNDTLFFGSFDRTPAGDKYAKLRILDFSDPSRISTMGIIERDAVAYHLKTVGS